MSVEKEIIDLLQEFQENTGMELKLDAGDDILPRLRELVSLTRVSQDKHSFLRSLCQGQLSAEARERGFQQYQLSPDALRGLILLEFPATAPDGSQDILDSLFPHSQVSPVSMGDGRYLLFVKQDISTIASLVSTLVDTMASEAMISIRVAYSSEGKSLLELDQLYQELEGCLKLGKLFYPSQLVFENSSLGLARLIDSLPESVCWRYLREHFSNLDLDQIDPDTQRAIQTLFDNHLALSETARQLYLHRNTLSYRLDKFHKSYGLDVRHFDDAVSCRIGMMIWQKLHPSS